MCDICDDVGFVRLNVDISDPRFGKLTRCTCKAAEDAARLQKLSGLTDTERNLTLDSINLNSETPNTAVMVAACRAFLASPTGMLTIHGTSGNAKTVALQACVNAMVRNNVEAVYITAFDLIGYVREAFTETKEIKSDSDHARLLRFGTVPFLAIDEFDKVKMSEWVVQEITDLIDRRYRLGVDGQAGTMIAMNNQPAALPTWIYSRLTQGEIIRNDDPDLRAYLK